MVAMRLFGAICRQIHSNPIQQSTHSSNLTHHTLQQAIHTFQKRISYTHSHTELLCLLAPAPAVALAMRPPMPQPPQPISRLLGTHPRRRRNINRSSILPTRLICSALTCRRLRRPDITCSRSSRSQNSPSSMRYSSHTKRDTANPDVCVCGAASVGERKYSHIHIFFFPLLFQAR